MPVTRGVLPCGMPPLCLLLMVWATTPPVTFTSAAILLEWGHHTTNVVLDTPLLAIHVLLGRSACFAHLKNLSSSPLIFFPIDSSHLPSSCLTSLPSHSSEAAPWSCCPVCGEALLYALSLCVVVGSRDHEGAWFHYYSN